MKTCEKCKVSVAGIARRCPLCQGELLPGVGEERAVFPVVPTIYRKFQGLFRLLIFLSIAVGVIAVAVNLMLPETGAWSLFVVGGLVCLWVSLMLAVKKRKNIPKDMLYQVALISIVCVIWDFATVWNGWSIDFVLPILCMAAMVAMGVLSYVLHWHRDETLIYICIDALFGVVPIIFYFTGCLSVVYPSVICVAASVLSVVWLMVFRGDSIWAELKRRLHF